MPIYPKQLGFFFIAHLELLKMLGNNIYQMVVNDGDCDESHGTK